MNRQSRQEWKRVGNNQFWVKVSRIDSYYFLRILVAFNVILFIFYIASIHDIYQIKSPTNPCIVVINAKESDKLKNFVKKINEKESAADNSKNILPVEPQQQIDNKSYWWTTETRGKYSLIRNYIQSDKPVSDENNIEVTLTTHTTYEYLHHSEQLCQRWDGFISIGVYAPGDDFKLVINLIMFMRQCSDVCVKRNISWHLVYDTDYGPKLSEIHIPESYVDDIVFDCSSDTMETIADKFITTFRNDHSLPYPINVVRNVARLSAKTRHILASDIELYPSINIVSMFRDLLVRERDSLIPAINRSNKHVYVIPIFEVSEDIEPPKTKSELIPLMNSGKAIFFHKWVCDLCQKFPQRYKWINALSDNNTLNVFLVTRRYKTRDSWEPLYIGTNDEPLYDERMTWDGKLDKMTQMYEMCLMKYDLVVLDNAFLVHSPGIKKPNDNDMQRREKYNKRNKKIYLRFKSLLARKYGNRKC